MSDQYFTPSQIASTLISAVCIDNPSIVADFAAGHGELLYAALNRWPESAILAGDVDVKCIRIIRERHPGWAAVKCDFLNDRSRMRSQKMRALLGRVDLIVLNPPFSGRGASKNRVLFDGSVVTCGQALAFVLVSLPFLVDNGHMVAILPASSLTSAKDRLAWRLLKNGWTVKVLAKFGHKTFPGCSASTVALLIEQREVVSSGGTTGKARMRSIARRTRHQLISGTLVRGCVPVFRADTDLKGQDYKFVHSTDLIGDNLSDVYGGVSVLRRSVIGPCVLVPRIGSPKRVKCTVYSGAAPIVLSDCVFGIECESLGVAQVIQQRIRNAWSGFARICSGTCAPYVTVEGLVTFLRNIGIAVETRTDKRFTVPRGKSRP